MPLNTTPEMPRETACDARPDADPIERATTGPSDQMGGDDLAPDDSGVPSHPDLSEDEVPTYPKVADKSRPTIWT